MTPLFDPGNVGKFASCRRPGEESDLRDIGIVEKVDTERSSALFFCNSKDDGSQEHTLQAGDMIVCHRETHHPREKTVLGKIVQGTKSHPARKPTSQVAVPEFPPRLPVRVFVSCSKTRQS